jgi:HEAT repeat protein
MDELAEASDVIMKAKALSSEPVADDWFDEIRGFEPYSTQMQVISVIKGDLPKGNLNFHHYGSARANAEFGFNYAPQFYKFEKGRSYIVFAKIAETKGVLRQLWKSHRLKMDQGLFLAADDKPVPLGIKLREIIWEELGRLLESRDPKDVIYAIRQFDGLSGGGAYYELNDFIRGEVVDKIHSFMSSKNVDIAKAAIETLASRNPYFRDNFAVHWLASIGDGKIQGMGKWDLNRDYAGARKYWRELAAIVDSDEPAEVRALALRAMGRAGQPKLEECLIKWTEDPEPLVRQAAVVLLSDFPGEKTLEILKKRSEDESAKVRLAVARAIGFGKFKVLLQVLEKLLDDKDTQVRHGAALSLISFAPKEVEKILIAHKEDKDFKSVFVNALAEENPEPYLDALAEIIEKRLEPTNFWGGQIPSFTSWNILFKYLQKQDVTELQSGKFNRCLEALENAKVHGSDQPRDLYAFYLQRNMKERAQRFREACKTRVSFDMEYFFDQVYNNPDIYQRN